MRNIAVIPGRFQGVTKAHEHIILDASKKCNKVFVVIVNTNRITKNNPFSYFERMVFLETFTRNLNNVTIISFKNGYIPDMLEHIKTDFNVKGKFIIHCGSDREEAYTKQVKHILYSVMLKVYMRDEEVSATKLREAVRNKDFETIIALTPKSIYSSFTLLHTMIGGINGYSRTEGIYR